jgi:hypothetical protein
VVIGATSVQDARLAADKLISILKVRHGGIGYLLSMGLIECVPMCAGIAESLVPE